MMEKILDYDQEEDEKRELMICRSNTVTSSPLESHFKETKKKYQQKRNSVVFCTDQIEKKITFIRSLGNKNGNSCYLAYNKLDKELLYITKWTIQYSQIEAKCNTKCFWFDVNECKGHKIHDFINSIDKYVRDFSKMQHRNVIPYKYVTCLKNKREKRLTIYLAQDFVFGSPVCTLTKSIGWHTEGVRTVAKGVLDALFYLDSCGTPHKCLNNSTVFLDKDGVVRCKDFFLVPYLQYLISNARNKMEAEDLPDLGKLLEGFMPSLPLEIKNFVDICKSNCALSRLLRHPFLQKSYNTIIMDKPGMESRFYTEFNQIEVLGRGAFGEVLKGIHNTDGQTYAIKRVRFLDTEGELYEKTKREAELMAKLEHRNVIRYFTSWVERQNPMDFDETDESANENSTENFSSTDAISETQKIFGLSTYMYIKMEYCNNFTLRNIIKNKLYSYNRKKWSFFCQIVGGLLYIHGKNIIHRDLKPENIFLNSDGILKIGDFGHATTISLAQSENEIAGLGTGEVGSSLYVAPELIGKASESIYNQKVDIYSLGIIFFEMNTSFKTEMERCNVITSLRDKNVISTTEIQKKIWCKSPRINTRIIHWLLRHKVDSRPSSFDLQCFIKCNKKTVPYLENLGKIN